MPHLEEVGGEVVWVRSEEPLFRRTFGVPDEEHRASPEPEPQDERRVVRTRPRLDAAARREHSDDRVAESRWGPAELRRPSDRHAAVREAREQRGEVGRSVGVPLEPAEPHLANLDRGERAHESEVMIGVRMRQDHDVEPRPSSRRELRHERTATDIRAADLAAAIDQQGAPIWKIDERSVALTNINHGHRQRPRRTAASARGELGERQRQQGRRYQYASRLGPSPPGDRRHGEERELGRGGRGYRDRGPRRFGRGLGE